MLFGVESDLFCFRVPTLLFINISGPKITKITGESKVYSPIDPQLSLFFNIGFWLFGGI